MTRLFPARQLGDYGGAVCCRISATTSATLTSRNFSSRRTISRCARTFVRNRLHLRGGDGVVSVNGRDRLRGAKQPERTARAGAEQQRRVPARGADNFQDAVAGFRRHVHCAHGFLAFQNAVGRRHGLERVNGMTQLEALDHLLFVGQRRITEVHSHQKAVFLRFGQKKRPFLLDGVLRGHDHERFLQTVGDVAHRDHRLAHRLEQRRLRARTGAVDFVHEDKLRKKRAKTKFRPPTLRVNTRLAQNVRRQKIGRALDPLERAAGALGHRTREHCFGDARNVFNQQMSLRQPDRRRQFDLFVLADDDFLDIGNELLRDGRNFHRGQALRLGNRRQAYFRFFIGFRKGNFHALNLSEIRR